MASEHRTPEELRRQIAAERDRLAAAVDEVQAGLRELTGIRGRIEDRLKARLPAVAGTALGTGFFLAGGIGATMRLLARRSRER